MLAAALTGYMFSRLQKWEQVVLTIGSIMVIMPSPTLTVAGALLAVPILARQLLARRQGQPAAS